MSIRDEVIKTEKVNNPSSLFSQFFLKPIAMIFSRNFAKWNWKPNFISFLSAVIGVFGAVYFCFDNIYLDIAGIILIIFSEILDCCDGQVARINHTGSINGRFIDGICDGIVYGAIYICLGIRLFDQNIPFTNYKWGFIIFAVFAIISVVFHAGQSRLVDYTRNFHMFMLNNRKTHELSSSIELKKELDSMDKKLDINRMRVSSYYTYTKAQEKTMKNCYKLSSVLNNNNLDVKEEAIKYLQSKISIYEVHLSSDLTFNLRTYPLFVFILIGYPVLLIPFVLLILEPIKLIFKYKYEKVAKYILENYYSEYIK